MKKYINVLCVLILALAFGDLILDFFFTTTKWLEAHSLKSYVNATNILTDVSFFISDSSSATLFTFN